MNSKVGLTFEQSKRKKKIRERKQNRYDSRIMNRKSRIAIAAFKICNSDYGYRYRLLKQNSERNEITKIRICSILFEIFYNSTKLILVSKQNRTTRRSRLTIIIQSLHVYILFNHDLIISRLIIHSNNKLSCSRINILRFL